MMATNFTTIAPRVIPIKYKNPDPFGTGVPD